LLFWFGETKRSREKESVRTCVCVCVRVSVCESESERERGVKENDLFISAFSSPSTLWKEPKATNILPLINF